MRVILSPELFEPPTEDMLLIVLLYYALEDRHHVELDTTQPSIVAWLAAQSPSMRDEIQLGLELSTRLEPRESAHTTVEITRSGPPDFECDPIRLPLSEARRFLDRPFVILLEDASSDRAFLERMLTDQERAFLRQREAAGAVRIDHGGGTGPTTRRVRAEAPLPTTRHRMWVLFDSDAMQPGRPSSHSEDLRIGCGRIPHHQLRRRYAESYLTHQALQGRAASTEKRSLREAQLEHFQAFVRMSDAQRHHFNMKNGFTGDAHRTDATAGQLYIDLSDADRKTLAIGFGTSVNELFADGSVTEADLRREAAGWTELRPVVRDLLARIR